MWWGDQSWSDWNYVAQSSPQQNDGVSCGIYTIEFILGILQGRYPRPDVQIDPLQKRRDYFEAQQLSLVGNA